MDEQRLAEIEKCLGGRDNRTPLHDDTLFACYVGDIRALIAEVRRLREPNAVGFYTDHLGNLRRRIDDQRG